MTTDADRAAQIRQAARDRAASLDRLETIDALHERALALVSDGRAMAIVLGQSADNTPIFAFGAGDGDRRMLVLGASPGDGPLTATVALLCVELADHFPGWEVWAVPCLDAARMRLNAPAAALKPTLSEHVLARRSPWSPGEDPEANLPIDHPPFWQPDSPPDPQPDGFVPSGAEAVALARAIRHLRPGLVVSLSERLAGGVATAASHGLPDEHRQALMDAVTCTGVPVHVGAKLRTGAQPHGTEGFVVLPDLAEERQRAGRDTPAGARLTGGVGSWQALEDTRWDAAYLACDLPRFTAAELADDAECDDTRDVRVDVQDRERGGRSTAHAITTLVAPGHPAGGAELRADAIKGDTDPDAGEHHGRPALVAWLAVEELLARRHALRDAVKVIEAASGSFQRDGHLRALQLLRETQPQDKLLRSYQSNRRYAQRATRAQAAYWQIVAPAQTAAILAEARRCLVEEDQRDPNIARAVGDMDDLIAAHTERASALRAVAPADLAEMAAAFVAAAVDVTEQGGPALIAARRRVETLTRESTAARREARDTVNRKEPRAEQRAAAETSDALEQQLADAREHLARLEGAGYLAERPAGNDTQPDDAHAAHATDGEKDDPARQERQAEAEAEAEPEPQPAGSDPPHPQTEPQAGPEPEEEPGTGPQSEPQAGPEPDAAPQSDPDPRPDNDVEREDGAEPQRPDPQPEDRPAADPTPQPGPGRDPDPDDDHPAPAGTGPSAQSDAADDRHVDTGQQHADDDRDGDVDQPPAERPPGRDTADQDAPADTDVETLPAVREQPQPLADPRHGLEERLPDHLRLGPEWPPGPLDYDRLRIDYETRPFATFTEAPDTDPDDDSGSSPDAADDRLMPAVVDAQPPQEPETEERPLHVERVGFRRRRVGVQPRSAAPAVPVLAAPPQGRGPWLPRTRPITPRRHASDATNP